MILQILWDDACRLESNNEICSKIFPMAFRNYSSWSLLIKIMCAFFFQVDDISYHNFKSLITDCSIIAFY